MEAPQGKKTEKGVKIRETTRKEFPKLKNEQFQSEGAQRMPNQSRVIRSRTRCVWVKTLSKSQIK